MNLEAYIFTMFSPWYLALAAVAVVFLAAFGVGSFAKTSDPLIDFALGIYGLSILGLWVSLRIPTGALLLVMLIFAVIGFWRVCRIWRSFGWLLLPISVIGLLTIASALLPPFAWDEQVYQAALPWHYLQIGSTDVLPDNPYSAYPNLHHFFLLNTLSWGGVNLPRLAVWLLTLILLSRALREFKQLSSNWMTGSAVCFAVIFTPAGLALNQAAYAEYYTLLFGFAGVIAYYKGENRKWAIISGLFAGMAAAVKLTSLSVGILLFAGWMLNAKRRKQIFFFILSAFVALFPYILRVWLATGDPFYPFGAKLFGSATMQLVAEYHHLLGSYRYGLGIVPGLAFGWIATALKPEIYDGLSVGLCAPILVMIAIFRVWHIWKTDHPQRKFLAGICAALFASYCFWALTSQQSRFIYPWFWAIGALTAYLSRDFSWRQKNIFALLLIVITLFSMNYRYCSHYILAWKNLRFARTQPVAFLSGATRDPEYFAGLKLLCTTRENSKTALLWERRTLYMPQIKQRSFRIVHPRFQELLTPPPIEAEDLFKALSSFDYLWTSMPNRDVDYQETFQEERNKLEEQIIQLLRIGKFHPTPDYKLLKNADK